MTVVFGVAFAGLILAACLIVYRLFVGPTVGDRIVALDTLLLVMVGAVGVEIVRLNTSRYAPLLLVISLLAFVGTLAVSRFIERYAAEVAPWNDPDVNTEAPDAAASSASTQALKSPSGTDQAARSGDERGV